MCSALYSLVYCMLSPVWGPGSNIHWCRFFYGLHPFYCLVIVLILEFSNSVIVSSLYSVCSPGSWRIWKKWPNKGNNVLHCQAYTWSDKQKIATQGFELLIKCVLTDELPSLSPIIFSVMRYSSTFGCWCFPSTLLYPLTTSSKRVKHNNLFSSGCICHSN